MSKFRNYDKYEVYEDGRIWSYKIKKFLKPRTEKNGYQSVLLYDNEGKQKRYYVHRIVWEAVTRSTIPKGMQINHRNEIKTSNIITNLELVTPKQNINWGSAIERRSKKMKGIIPKANPPKQVGAFKDGKLILTFQSTQEAGRNGFNIGSVSMCCNGKRKTHKGFTWQYI